MNKSKCSSCRWTGDFTLHDLQSLARCIALFRKERPLVVNASTPKAGLVVTVAARICGVPVRIYTMRGLRMETTAGWKRNLLLTMEKIAASSATHCLAVSDSLRERAVEFGITSEEKISVLGKGSGDGFDVARFKPHRKLRQPRRHFVNNTTSTKNIPFSVLSAG